MKVDAPLLSRLGMKPSIYRVTAAAPRQAACSLLKDLMTDLSRRMLICGASTLGWKSAVAARKEDVRVFGTAGFDIKMSVEYHDGYASSGLWFRDRISSARFCLSAKGDQGRNCIANFRGSLAVAQYTVTPRSDSQLPLSLREHVRTVDNDTRLRARPPFDRTIELKAGTGSDVQAFGYEPSQGDEPADATHGPWYLFRQDLFLEPQGKLVLAIFWKHALHCIRVLDVIPGEQTWQAVK